MTTSRGNQTNVTLDEPAETLYNPGYTDEGRSAERDATVPLGTTHDISQRAKATLGNYLSAATRGQVYVTRANSFAVPEGSENTLGDGFQVSANASTNLQASQAAEQMRSAGTTLGTFIDLTKGLNDTAATKFSSTKDSDYAGANPFLDTEIKRVGTTERARGSDGNTLLSSVQGTFPGGREGAVDVGSPTVGPPPENASPVEKRISEVLRQNRFSSVERAFVEDHKRSVPGGYTVQRSMGKYDPNAPEVNEEKLQDVARQLMIRSTGHAVTGDLLSPTSDPKLLANLVPLIPSFTQATGLRLINVSNLEARNVPITNTETPARSEYIDQEYDQFDVFGGLSYGVLNSDLEPFEDPFPVGTLTATVGSLLSVIILSGLIAGLTSIADVRNSGAADRRAGKARSPWDLKKGSFNAEEDESWLLDLLSIPRTDYSWGTCFVVGFTNFLGVELPVDNVSLEGGGQSTDLTAGAGDIALAFLEALWEFVKAPPGYYAGVLRNAARSVENIIDATAEIIESFSNVDLVGGAARIWSLISTVTDTAAWRFTMSMATVGNQILYSQRNTYKNIDYTDVSSEKTLHERSRVLDGGTQRTAYSPTLRTKYGLSKYLLPPQFLTALNQGSAAHLVGNASPETSKFLPLEGSQTNRISPEDVKLLENKLDAEYMPFYFHDLRTNEIISFSAFLNDLSDGFSANYTTSQGYGRADEVMVYNSTKRSISLEFFLAATSEEDLNKMYWDINKLVSMVYPQYSRGRVLQSGNLKFIQPFSQLPTASPMIRLRVGDIIKGNYSRFGIARLFGLGNGPEVFTGNRDLTQIVTGSSDAGPSSTERTTHANEVEQKAKDVDGFIVNQEVRVAPGDYKYVNRQGTIYTNRNAIRGTRSNIRNPKRYSDEFIGTIAVEPSPPLPPVPRPAPANRPGATGRRARAAQQPVPEQTPDQRLQSKKYRIKLKDETPGLNPEFNYIDVQHTQILGFSTSQLEKEATRWTGDRNTQATRTPDRLPPPSPQALSVFLDKNTLIKSFETTRGKGLAGFITDLKFTWMDSTWETAYAENYSNNRAPIAMKIGISFSPIHDIPMGLDSEGMMRSVAYNVGNASSMIGSDPYREGDSTSAQTTSAAASPPAPGGGSAGTPQT